MTSCFDKFRSIMFRSTFERVIKIENMKNTEVNNYLKNKLIMF